MIKKKLYDFILVIFTIFLILFILSFGFSMEENGDIGFSYGVLGRLKSQEEKITMENNDQHLLLVTCYPFNAIRSGTPYRYVVSAKKYII